ncbi:uncharacterized protein BDZ99DRAFT_564988 [Mytilinidion resinicola]|uniref:Uncharacterized protein n=1 Tax=Mytilinidion resinicola TaxID=574789 RepID=A0A6A6ZAI6_9PEZI|nr:uncharacterized protein BDZ99DRAFT_564988 [Mytilinidion resinicola]KAF2817217.1 hypothetical protein BDZ99DRAFT_564988 [Mytilinidion resinicola]
MGSPLLRRFALQRSSLRAQRRLVSTAAPLPQLVAPRDRLGSWSYPGCFHYRRTVAVSSQVDSILPKHLLMEFDKLPNLTWDQDPFLVLFLTPTFARWLLDDQTFLQPALLRLFNLNLQDPDLERSYHALVAVVDRLPTPAHPGRGYRKGRWCAPSPPSPPFSELGFEGMAYTLLNAGQFLPPHIEALHEPMGEGSRQKPGTINIHIDSSIASASETPIPHSVLQLPLANTVFHTGHSSTMFQTLWKKEKGSLALKLVSKEQLQHTSFAWPDWHSTGVQSASLSVPLTPITMPRQIEAGMGNIIRRIQGENSQSITASQELEETVPRYFATKNIPACAMKVWALVIPKDAMVSVTTELVSRFFISDPAAQDVLHLNAAFQELWKKDRPVWNDAVSFAISRGARLHRVLSGGGGWGKKAGLLSLDPDIFYDEPTITSLDSDIDMLELFDVEKSALKEVAEPGEFIQFFVRGPDDLARLNHEVTEHLDDSQTVPIYLELGTIPSTIDNIPNIEQQSHASVKPLKESIHVFHGHFGALSEGGMSIVRVDGHFNGEKGVQTRSKIDVPFSRFIALQLDEKDVSAMIEKKALKRNAKQQAKRLAKKAERAAKVEEIAAEQALTEAPEMRSAPRHPSNSASIRNLASALNSQSIRLAYEDDDTTDAEHQIPDDKVSEDLPRTPFRNPATKSTRSFNKDPKDLPIRRFQNPVPKNTEILEKESTKGINQLEIRGLSNLKPRMKSLSSSLDSEAKSALDPPAIRKVSVTKNTKILEEESAKGLNQFRIHYSNWYPGIKELPSALDSETESTLGSHGIRKVQRIFTGKVEIPQPIPAQKVSERNLNIRYHALKTNVYLDEESRQERIRRKSTKNENVTTTTPLMTPPVTPFEIRIVPTREPENPPTRRTPRRISKNFASLPIKSRLHKIAGSVVPEHLRKVVFTAVWNGRLKRASRSAEAMAADKDADVLMVKVPIQGEDKKYSEDLTEGEKLRARWTAWDRERLRSLRRSAVEPTSLNRTRSRRSSPPESIGSSKASSPGRVRLKKILSPDCIRPRKVPSPDRIIPRKVRAMGPSPEQREKRISDPEVAQLIDEVETWLAWDAKPPS